MLAGAAVHPDAVGCPQQAVTAVVQRAVVDLAGVVAEVRTLQLAVGQQPFVPQGLEINEIGVACKGRAALIGAVPVAGGAQGQDLPDGLAAAARKSTNFTASAPKQPIP